MEVLKSWYERLPKSISALIEVGILFLPGIPAYIWVWPILEGTANQIFQGLVYLYVIGGTLLIGLRRWTWNELGINLKGITLSLACGVALVGGRSLIILSVDWGAPAPSFTALQILGEFLYYFGLVGIGEEILCRGLLYRALEDWRGLRWAIWGSSVGFGLWHIFGQGPLVGVTMVLYGLVFALMRWRAGGILGLILVHGAIDFAGVLMTPDTDVVSMIGRIGISSRAGILAGMGLLVLLPLYLWLAHPKVNRALSPRSI